MIAQSSAIVDAWTALFPASPPVGYYARTVYSREWIRAYTLPGGKRLPTTPADRRTILKRLNEICDALVSEGDDAFFLLTTFDGTGEEFRGVPVELFPIREPPKDWAAALSGYVDVEQMVVWSRDGGH